MQVKYCLPIIKNSKKEVLKMILENKSSYDFFEVWLDYVGDLDENFIKELVKKFDGKLIFLFRRQNLEKIQMPLKKRIEIMDLVKGSECFIDLDLSQKAELKYSRGMKLITSYHNYQETPSEVKLHEIILKMRKVEAYIYKVSTYCNDQNDAFRLMNLLTQIKNDGFKTIVIGMGEEGFFTRIYGTILGNEMVFAPNSLNEASAPGQLTKVEFEKIFKKIKIFYFIADTVEHSLSPQMHHAGYKTLGIEDKFVFLRQRVRPDELKAFINQKRADPNFGGASISIPHKMEVIKYLDQIDKVAKNIGAVNTIVKRKGKLIGYNTDWLGILIPLKKCTNLKGKKAAVVGAGGAAMAAVYALTTLGIKPTIFDRTLEKAKALAHKFGCEYEPLENIYKLSSFDIIIHATKVGMNPNDTPLIPKRLIKSNQIIFDVVYSRSHPETKLLKYSREKKALTISGTEMLIYQGVAQFELLTNKKIPVEIMRKARQ